eukprot:364448-Chlamydomonas_euryale.AAC.4
MSICLEEGRSTGGPECVWSISIEFAVNWLTEAWGVDYPEPPILTYYHSALNEAYKEASV